MMSPPMVPGDRQGDQRRAFGQSILGFSMMQALRANRPMNNEQFGTCRQCRSSPQFRPKRKRTYDHTRTWASSIVDLYYAPQSAFAVFKSGNWFRGKSAARSHP
jgi:hypothetical protein